MSVTSEWLSRKLGYGFAYDEQLPNPTDWIEAARAQVAVVPKFDPWRLIAKNPDATKLSERGLPEELTTFRNYCHREKGFNIPIDDLRYPTNLSVTISHFRKMNSERDRLRQLQAQGKISEQAVSCNWWKKYNAFSWWRDTLTRGVDNVLGDTPVLNRFWHFWINHFSVGTDGCEGELFGSLHLTIRENLAGKFDQLLYAAVSHPAIQQYLQNNRSVGPKSERARYNRANDPAQPTSINENLGRELLELYTVSPQAGYTQDDVNGATFILTGWGDFWSKNSTSDFFSLDAHEPGNHKVMGKVYKDSDAKSQLSKLCVDLSNHPMTAKHIARKLANHFISDNPPQEAIDAIAFAFTTSNGSLVAVHHAVIDEVVKAGPEHKKFVTPERWFWLLHRTTKQRLPSDFMGPDPMRTAKQVDAILADLGELHSQAPQPNGWPDTEIDWVTPEYLDRRIRYSNILGTMLYDPYYFDAKAYSQRVLGPDHPTTKLVERAESYPVACSVLFCSEAFLRI